MCQWDDTIVMQIGDKPVDVDRCIAPLVKALNEGGCPTRASCCGHGRLAGNIMLQDGRELIICSDFETARRVYDLLSPLNIHGKPRG